MFRLVIVLFVFITSSQAKNLLAQNVLAKEETRTLTVLLLSEDTIYSYTGSDFRKGTKYGKETFKNLLIEKKQKNGDSLLVIIKPTQEAGYQFTLHVLDQMTIHGIKHYAIVRPFKEEEDYFAVKDLLQLRDPVEIKSPSIVTTEKLPEGHIFLIEMRKDLTVWFQIISKENKSNLQMIENPVTKSLAHIIFDYERSLPGTSKNYLIKGDEEVPYFIFKQVMDALKENKIYKYNLVTTEK